MSNRRLKLSIIPIGFRLLVWLMLLKLVLTPTQVKAQDNFTMWLDFDYRTYVKPKLWLGGDAGVRGFFNTQNGITMYVRPTVNYRINTRFNTGGGLGLFDTFGNENNVFELRFFQSLVCTWPELKRVKFNGRFQLEERNIAQSIPDTDQVSRMWIYRGRFKVEMSTYYFNIGEKLKNVYLNAHSELFSSFGPGTSDVFIDQYRIGLGLGQLLPKGFRYEVDVIGQYSKPNISQNFDRSPWILRFRGFLQKPEK